MKNLVHSDSFHAGEKIAPSKPGIKHLAATALMIVKPASVSIASQGTMPKSERRRNQNALDSAFFP